MTITVDSMSVFHLCSDYARQSLYPHLLRAISAQGVQQFMYVPVRTEDELGKGLIDDDPSVSFRFEHLLRRYHKFFFRTKIQRVLADVIKETPIQDFQLVHAHFLYSDGAVALGLYRKLGTPYVVAVRNSDLNFFMRFRPDLVGIRNDVLRYASRVIFLSQAYAEALRPYLPIELKEKVMAKTMIVPNGLTADWLNDNFKPDKLETAVGHTLKLLYVGDFTPNKNIAGIVSALKLLQSKHPTTLTVVGGGGDPQCRTQALLKRNKDHGVICLGRVDDINQLRHLYRTHDVFVMPSYNETFGITYIESLSQGVPIVHSRGQGVDGYFTPGTVASSVDPHDPMSIAEGVSELYARLPALKNICRNEARRFEWRSIGETYKNIYTSILEEK